MILFLNADCQSLAVDLRPSTSQNSQAQERLNSPYAKLTRDHAGKGGRARLQGACARAPHSCTREGARSRGIAGRPGHGCQSPMAPISMSATPGDGQHQELSHICDTYTCSLISRMMLRRVIMIGDPSGVRNLWHVKADVAQSCATNECHAR